MFFETFNDCIFLINSPQIYIQRRSQNMHHFYSDLRLKLVVFRFFLYSKYLWFVNNICQLHPVQSEHEDKHAQNAATSREDSGCICFAFTFVCVLGKAPNLGTMADNTITQSSIRGPRSPMYICVNLRKCWPRKPTLTPAFVIDIVCCSMASCIAT